jgi:hypothetical protein
MDRKLQWIFSREVERQCRFGLLAASDLTSALNARDGDRMWYSIQSVLIAAGNVSKLLWPSQSSCRKRGEDLRAHLGVVETSPLAPRSFRNHFEHFDERLESWATSSKRRNLADSNVGPTGMIAGLEPGDYLRNFDTDEYAVTFRGDTYELKPVVAALGNLHGRAASELSRPPWK